MVVVVGFQPFWVNFFVLNHLPTSVLRAHTLFFRSLPSSLTFDDLPTSTLFKSYWIRRARHTYVCTSNSTHKTLYRCIYHTYKSCARYECHIPSVCMKYPGQFPYFMYCMYLVRIIELLRGCVNWICLLRGTIVNRTKYC